MDSPYGSLKEVKENLQEEERVPWSEANIASRDTYTKNKDSDTELAVYVLLDQTEYHTPDTFYDPASNELVSFAEDAGTISFKDILEDENEKDIDVDSLLVASAQRGLVGDSDTVYSQYAVSSSGQVYTFDFGLSGNPLTQEFRKEGRGIVGTTTRYLEQLRQEDEILEENESEASSTKLREKVGDELEKRMREMAQQIDIGRFKSEVDQHPYISSDVDSENNYGIPQLITNVESLRNEDFDLVSSSMKKSNLAVSSVNLGQSESDSTSEESKESNSETSSKTSPSKVPVEETK